MSAIKYVELSEVKPEGFLPLLNNPRVRQHLVKYELFDADSVTAWIDCKLKMDATSGCRVRAILIDDRLVGWCGIQLEGNRYEMAIILDDQCWGIGKAIFHELMRWAKALGHDELLIHFLHTRREYGFLRKISKTVSETELLGNKFTTYLLEVR